MGVIARQDRSFGRRSPRLRVGMPARLVTLERSYAITLEDLSPGGARITLPAPDAFTVCVLRWMDYHGFDDVAWRDDLAVGLRFDAPISDAMLEATRLYAPHQLTPLQQEERGLRNC